MLVCDRQHLSSFCKIAFCKSVQVLLRNMGGFKGMKTEGQAIPLNQQNFFFSTRVFFDTSIFLFDKSICLVYEKYFPF